jgi:hypothetical protein
MNSICMYVYIYREREREIMEVAPDHYVRARKVRWARFLWDQTQSRAETCYREIWGKHGRFSALDTRDA